MEHPHQRSGAFSISDGIARVLLITLAAIVPFCIIPLPYVAIPQGKVLGLASLFILTLLVWTYARLSEGMLHIPRSALFYVSALLPIAYLASTLVTGWSSVSLVGFGVEQDTLAAVTFMAALFLLTGFLFYGNSAGVRLFLQSFSVGLIVLFALEILYVFLPEWFNLGVLSGQTANTFGSWHDLGIIAGLSFFASFALWHSDFFAGRLRFVPALLGIVSLSTLILVHFADIFYASGALFLIAGAMVAKTAYAHGGGILGALKSAALWIFVAAVFIVGGFFGAQVWDKLPSPIQIAQTEVRPSWQGTFDLARQSLQAPADLIFGTGPNSFIREWSLHKPAGVNQTPFWNSDFNVGVGIIPTSAFSSGLIGLLAWAALLFVLLGLIYRFVRETRPLTIGRALLGFALLVTGYLVAYHMIYTPGTALTAITFLALGLLAALAAGDSSARVVRIGVSGIGDAARLIVFVVVVLASLAAAGVMGREVLSNIFVNRSAYLYQTTNDVAAAGSALGKAFIISPHNDRAHRAAAELGVVRLAQLMQDTDPKDTAATAQLQATLQETIQHGLNAVSIDSSNYQNWLLLAQVYGNLAGVNIEGAYEQARSAYESAAAVNPTNPLPKFRLAQLMLVKDDRAGARDALNAALTLKPDFAAAHYLLSQVEAAEGNADVAVQSALSAAQLVPEDPLGWFNLGYILYAKAAYQDAAVALQEAIRLSPDYSNALYYLGLTAYQLKDMNNAALIFDRVAELNKEVTWLPEVAANIRAGKEPFEGIEELQQQAQ
ncbi:MAG: tetratricopeptide repeat protein [Patescibacteria group bacterium]